MSTPSSSSGTASRSANKEERCFSFHHEEARENNLIQLLQKTPCARPKTSTTNPRRNTHPAASLPNKKRRISLVANLQREDNDLLDEAIHLAEYLVSSTPLESDYYYEVTILTSSIKSLDEKDKTLNTRTVSSSVPNSFSFSRANSLDDRIQWVHYPSNFTRFGEAHHVSEMMSLIRPTAANSDCFITFEHDIPAWLVAEEQNIPVLHLKGKNTIPVRDDSTIFFLKYNTIRREHGLKPIRTLAELSQPPGVVQRVIPDPFTPPCLSCQKITFSYGEIHPRQSIIVVDQFLIPASVKTDQHRRWLRHLLQTLSLVRQSLASYNRESVQILLLLPPNSDMDQLSWIQLLPDFVHTVHDRPLILWDLHATYNVQRVLLDCRKHHRGIALYRSYCWTGSSSLAETASSLLNAFIHSLPNSNEKVLRADGSEQVRQMVDQLVLLKRNDSSSWGTYQADMMKMPHLMGTRGAIPNENNMIGGGGKEVFLVIALLILLSTVLYAFCGRDRDRRRHHHYHHHQQLHSDRFIFESLWDEFVHYRMPELDHVIDLCTDWSWKEAVATTARTHSSDSLNTSTPVEQSKRKQQPGKKKHSS